MSKDDRGDLGDPKHRAEKRVLIARALADFRARRAAADLYDETRAAVIRLGDALDRLELARLDDRNRRDQIAVDRKDPPASSPGRGEIMWRAAIRALGGPLPPRPAPEPMPPVDVFWVGWASDLADDDLIAEVMWPHDERQSALDKVRQHRARYSRWNAPRRAALGLARREWPSVPLRRGP